VKDRQNVWLTGEPTVEEALADPIVLTLLSHDGLNAEDVSAAVRAARARLQGETKGDQDAA